MPDSDELVEQVFIAEYGWVSGNLSGRAGSWCNPFNRVAHRGSRWHCGARLVDAASITPIGAVLTGDAPGRASPDDITIFDSSGIALQDLAMAAFVLQRLENGEGQPQGRSA